MSSSGGRDVQLVSVAAVAENGVIGRRETFEARRDDLPGSAQIVLRRSEGEYDVATAHHADGVDDEEFTLDEWVRESE